jgi:hypothetical protein
VLGLEVKIAMPEISIKKAVFINAVSKYTKEVQ